MKRILALVLAMMMIAGMLVGCGETEEDEEEEQDKGAVISVYIGDEIRNWDPALTYTLPSHAKFFSLVYEGLTRITSEGVRENALAKEIKIIEDEKNNEYKMQIELVETAWSDGRQVSADDFIYAWKRLLEPDYQSTACCMLYDIKNARAVRMGDATIDDLGLEALDTTLLQITFEGKIDYDLFLEYCASPALVPLREDVVGRYSDVSAADYWAKKSATILSSGPFCVKNMDADGVGKSLTLQRNDYYHALDGNKEGKIDKYVKPYRLNMNFGYDADGRTTAYSYDYNTGAVEITGGTLSTPADQIMYLADVKPDTEGAFVQDTLSAYSLYFNTTASSVTGNAKVRQALSVALDRNKIAGMLTAAKPATGLVPYGVYYSTLGGEQFRAKAGDAISASANLDKAKSLLKEAGVSSGTITLCYYKAREAAADIMNYVKETWESLGFTVKLDEKGVNQYTTKFYKNDDGIFDFDVIAYDYQTLATNAFSVLAPFAVPFSGSAKDIENNDFSDCPSMSGYQNEAYDALIEEAYAAESREAMGDKLIEAEKLLMEDSPIIPLVFNVDTYVFNAEVLSKISSNIFGGRVFTLTKMKDYELYEPVVTMSPEDAATADLAE